jgi:hypothetical protein
MQSRRQNAWDSSHRWFQHTNLRLNVVRVNKTMKILKQHKLSLELAHHEYRPSTLQVNQHAGPNISRLFKLPIYIMTIGGVTQTPSWPPLLSAINSVMHTTHTWRIALPWSIFLVDTENLGGQQQKSILKLVNDWSIKFAYCTACRHLHYNHFQHQNCWLTTLKFEPPFYIHHVKYTFIQYSLQTVGTDKFLCCI